MIHQKTLSDELNHIQFYSKGTVTECWIFQVTQNTGFKFKEYDKVYSVIPVTVESF